MPDAPTTQYAVRLVVDGEESWYGADAPGLDFATAYDTMFRLWYEYVDLMAPKHDNVSVTMMVRTDAGWEEDASVTYFTKKRHQRHRAA